MTYRIRLYCQTICLMLGVPIATQLVDAQVLLWDFEVPGEVPSGWSNGWNAPLLYGFPDPDHPFCDQEPGNQSCDYQHNPWRVDAGQLVPPEYDDLDAEGMDAYVDSPAFKSLPPQTDPTANEGIASILSFLVAYDPDGLGQSSFDTFQVFLFEIGNAAPATLLDLPFGEPAKWTDRDRADNSEGVTDNIIRINHPIEADTAYNMRVRAWDFDSELGTLGGVGVDDIAVTDGVILYSGDFNTDGIVNGADLIAWQNGSTDQNDSAALALWQNNFGLGASTGQAVIEPIPEPSFFTCLALGIVAAFCQRPTARKRPKTTGRSN